MNEETELFVMCDGGWKSLGKVNIDTSFVFYGVSMCTPSRDNTLTGYNVTEEFKQLEKVEVYESAS